MKKALLLLSILFAGCELNDVVLVEPPAAEVPIVNIPEPLRQRNWASKSPQKYGQGSCVHASSISLFRWLGEEQLADAWRSKYSGGETSVSITRYWRDNGIPYISTLNEKTYECSGDPGFLRWVSENRLGCILWWKTSHCCTFVGFCHKDGQDYAAVLDNNYPEKYEYHPAEEFIRRWRGFGGFACAAILSPTPNLPYPLVMPTGKRPDVSFWNTRIF